MTAFAAVMRFLFLARKPFWFDECFSAEVAGLRWHDFAFLLWRREANMSLYYLALRGWLHFGSSPFFIRSLSVIISVATLPAIYWLAGKLFDRRVAFLATALMSVNAYHIRYAQEARSYSLFVLLATLSSGFFVLLLREDSRRNRWGYVVFGVLAVYAHLYALLLLAAQALAVPGVKWIRTRANLAGLRNAWIWIGAFALPLVIFAAKTGAGPIRWIQRPGPREILEFGEHLAGNDGLLLLVFYSVACGAALLHRRTRTINRGQKPALVEALDGPAEAVLLQNTSPDEANDATEAGSEVGAVHFLTIWLTFPITLMLALSLVRPLFLGRYFIFCLPALVILAAAGLASFRKNWVTAVGLAAMLMLSMQGTFAYYDRDFDLERDDSQGAASYILDHTKTGDALLFHIAEARVPYEFFRSIRGESRPSDDTQSGPETIFPRHGDRLDYRDFTGKPDRQLVKAAARSYSRVWLVLMSNGTPGKPDATTIMLNQTLGESLELVEVTRFSEVEVRLYRNDRQAPDSQSEAAAESARSIQALSKIKKTAQAGRPLLNRNFGYFG